MTLPATPSRRPRWLVPLLIAVVLALVAAAVTTTWALTRPAERADAAAPTPTPAANVAAPTAAVPTSAAPVAGTHKLGARVPFAVGDGNVTALEYRQPVARNAARSDIEGTEWGAARVRVCSTTGEFTVSESPWALVYADGGVIEPSSFKYSEFPEPEFPVLDRPVRIGGCVSGWIVFPALKGQRPQLIEYIVDSEPHPIDWSVS